MRKLNQGFSLVEVMVATVILSIGLVSVSLAQLRSVQASYSAFAQVQAAIAASSAESRLWANVCTHTADVSTITTQWQQSLNTTQTGTISSTVPGTYTITISWQDRQGDKTFSYTTILPVISCS